MTTPAKRRLADRRARNRALAQEDKKHRCSFGCLVAAEGLAKWEADHAAGTPRTPEPDA